MNWLRNKLRVWLGIQTIEDKLWLQPKLVSREGNRIEPASVVSTISVTTNPPPEAKEPDIKKGYDASVR